MKEEIIQFIGEKEGPTSIILVGVHGDEKCGAEAFERMLPTLEIEAGRVLFGYGNPRAISADKRFMEADLNRMFKCDDLIGEQEKKSYEYGRAQFLKKYLDQADVLLDIHASFTEESSPFIICEENAKEIVKYLPMDTVVSGFDRLEPGGTDGYMNGMGKIGICVECGYLGDSRSLRRAEESIFAFLGARGHRSINMKLKKQSYICMNELYKAKTERFRLTKAFADFEEIEEGQPIGIDGIEEVWARKSGIILFAKNTNQIDDEVFLFGEKKSSLARILQG